VPEFLHDGPDHGAAEEPVGVDGLAASLAQLSEQGIEAEREP